VKLLRWLSAPALAALLVGGAFAAETDKKKDVVSFAVLRCPAADEARAQAMNWLKTTGKVDEAKFNAIWTAERPLLDKVTDTLILGDANAAKLMAEARDSNAAAPTEVPAILKDAKANPYLRSNLALAYAKALSNRKVYEEALETLKLVKPEQVVDPSAYLFHKAVAEHALLMKKDANDTIGRLLDDAADAPERYRMVAALMAFDIMTWKDKSLDEIGRKMDNIQRRLDLTRGGEKTQKQQKEVVARLDEMIKELENQSKCQGGCCNGGACPSGGQQGGDKPNNNTQASSPQNDSNGGNGSGPGQIDPKVLKAKLEEWGKLPEAQRAEAILKTPRTCRPATAKSSNATSKRSATRRTVLSSVFHSPRREQGSRYRYPYSHRGPCCLKCQFLRDSA